MNDTILKNLYIETLKLASKKWMVYDRLPVSDVSVLDTPSLTPIYFISDIHFGHKNIIKYCNRPFLDENEMNDTIIKNINETIKKDDILIIVGDVSFMSMTETNRILNELNGYKILIIGNHDIERGEYKLKPKTHETHLCKVLNNLLVTHYPLKEVPDGYINVHGHIHNNSETSDKHFNVSVEVIEYKPISFGNIVNAKGIAI